MMNRTTAIVVAILSILKLIGTIDWSWWYVTAIVWFPFVAVGALTILLLVADGILEKYIYYRNK